MRILALTDSIALVVHTIRRISLSNCRNGTNSGHAFSHKRTIAGYLASMIHRGVLWCDLRLVEPQDGWILAVGVLIRPGCPGGCRFHCGGLLVLSVGRWFGGYWGQPGWRDQMRVQALTRSSAQAQSSGGFKIW